MFAAHLLRIFVGVGLLGLPFWATVFVDTAGARDCGGLNQPKCGLSEGLRACRHGLTASGGRCARPKKEPGTLTCGGRNRRPCGRDEGLRRCGPGLVSERGTCVPAEGNGSGLR